MPSFFIIFTLVLCSIHAYLFFKLRNLFSGAPAQLGLLLFLLAMLALTLLRRRAVYEYLPDFMPWVIYTWLGFAMIAFGCYLAVDVARVLLLIVKFITGLNAGALLAPRLSAPLTLLAVLGFCAYGMYEARDVEIKHLTIPSAKLALGSERVRIVALSDLHIGETLGLRDLEKWATMVKEQNPDIVVIAGDLIDADMSSRDDEARALRAMLGRFGGYAVHGNHEVYSGLNNARSFVRRSGFVLLENKSTVSDGINIVGIDDPQVANFGGGSRPDVVKVLESVDQDKFTLLLKHQPIFQKGEVGLFDLQISGHTHGGQLWPNKYITQKIFGFHQGLTRMEAENGATSLLYLMNGTGYWGPPMRLGARPDIIVLDIVPAQ